VQPHRRVQAEQLGQPRRRGQDRVLGFKDLGVAQVEVGGGAVVVVVVVLGGGGGGGATTWMTPTMPESLWISQWYG
jgi:hypothetical protein